MAEVLRHFGLRPAGGNHKLLRRWLEEWEIPYDHFAGTPPPGRREPIPLDEVLVPGSRYQRGQLKQRLYDAGLKQRACELCGQGEEWHGRRMSLILDHINGVADDNRLDNLRIVCPNCAATLDTHCGRANRRPLEEHACERCGVSFRPKSARQRFCSRECGMRRTRPRRCTPRRAPALRSAARGDRGDELVSGRTEVRRERQRGPQVGAGLRARATG